MKCAPTPHLSLSQSWEGQTQVSHSCLMVLPQWMYLVSRGQVLSTSGDPTAGVEVKGHLFTLLSVTFPGQNASLSTVTNSSSFLFLFFGILLPAEVMNSRFPSCCGVGSLPWWVASFCCPGMPGKGWVNLIQGWNFRRPTWLQTQSHIFQKALSVIKIVFCYLSAWLHYFSNWFWIREWMTGYSLGPLKLSKVSLPYIFGNFQWIVIKDTYTKMWWCANLKRSGLICSWVDIWPYPNPIPPKSWEGSPKYGI